MASILKVNEIQHTGGTSALTIDSSGRVLQPAKPAFSVYLSTDASAQNFATLTKVRFDTKDFDIGNNVTLDNSAVFTAPINGIYHFGCNVMLDAVEASAYVDLMLQIDDAQINGAGDLTYRHLEDVQGGSYASLHTTALIQLTANQTVTPYIRVNGDTSVNLRDGQRFFGYLVS